MGTNRRMGKRGCSASEGSSSRWAAPSWAFWGKTLPVAGWVGLGPPRTRGEHRSVASSVGSGVPKVGGEMSGSAWCLIILRNLRFFKQGGKKRKKSISSSCECFRKQLVGICSRQREKNQPYRITACLNPGEKKRTFEVPLY